MLTTSDLPVQEMFYAAGVFLFWISHRFSSFYLAWRTQAYHPLLKNQQGRFVFIPLLLVSVVFAVLFIPESVLPSPGFCKNIRDDFTGLRLGNASLCGTALRSPTALSSPLGIPNLHHCPISGIGGIVGELEAVWF